MATLTLKTESRGFRAIKRGPVPVTGPSVLLTGLLVPLTGPPFPLRCPFILSNCRSQFPGFSCIGPLGAAKNIGLGWT